VERARLVAIGAAIFVAVYAAVFLFSMLVPSEAWWYEPLEREWAHARLAGPVAIDYYGRVGSALFWGLGAAAIAMGLAGRVLGALQPGSFAFKMAGGYAILLTLTTLAATAWLLAQRRVIPLEMGP
jgi:hypothetical protein